MEQFDAVVPSYAYPVGWEFRESVEPELLVL
jgi:hypothetical protein